jgi:nucleoside phosphorylase
MIAVTFALPTESSLFVRQLRDRTDAENNGLRTVRGRVENNAVEILHTGVGEKICRARITDFLRARNFRLLISSGFAGGVGGGLQTGDLILARNLSEPELLVSAQQILQKHSVRAVNLHTSKAIVDSISERTRIASDQGADAVDMETEVIAQACAAGGIPLLSLRVISDTPLEPLPAPPAVLFDVEHQKTPIGSLAAHLIRHPSTLGRLLLFQRQIAKARGRLSEALLTLLRATSG